MKSKDKDVEYCGVDYEKIENAKPVLDDEVIRYHHLYIFERHKIYKKKEIEKLPPDWTDDEVLKNFRFTNVRRELDKESRWLIENISENETLTIEEKILWTILFRSYNKSETFRILGFPNSLSILDLNDNNIEEIRKVIEDHTSKNPKYVWYTNVFNCGGIKAIWAMPEKNIYECTGSDYIVTVFNTKHKKASKEMTWREAKKFVKENPEYKIDGVEENMPLRMMHLVKYAKDKDIPREIISAESQQEVFEIIQKIPGMAHFLSYQVFVDLTYIPEFPFSENEFTVSGPGCSLGLSYLFKDKDGMTDEECLFWVRDNIHKEWERLGLETDLEGLFDHLPEHDRKLNVMLLENSFCENSKMTKAKRGTGRPRNKYNSSVTIEPSNQLF